MEILRNQARIIIGGRARTGIPRHRAGAVVHHVVEINADAEPMRRLDHLDQAVLACPITAHVVLPR